MPWKIVPNEGGKFCVVKKSDGKVVKCHPTEKLAKLHLTALYANEPSVAKKSVGYGMLKSLIEERVEEIKACGANKPGGGGFAAGNTCARGGKGGVDAKTVEKTNTTEYHVKQPGPHGGTTLAIYDDKAKAQGHQDKVNKDFSKGGKDYKYAPSGFKPIEVKPVKPSSSSHSNNNVQIRKLREYKVEA